MNTEKIIMGSPIFNFRPDNKLESKIDQYQADKKINTRSKAIIELIELGLRVSDLQNNADEELSLKDIAIQSLLVSNKSLALTCLSFNQVFDQNKSDSDTAPEARKKAYLLAEEHTNKFLNSKKKGVVHF